MFIANILMFVMNILLFILNMLLFLLEMSVVAVEVLISLGISKLKQKFKSCNWLQKNL